MLFLKSFYFIISGLTILDEYFRSPSDIILILLLSLSISSLESKFSRTRILFLVLGLDKTELVEGLLLLSHISFSTFTLFMLLDLPVVVWNHGLSLGFLFSLLFSVFLLHSNVSISGVVFYET